MLAWIALDLEIKLGQKILNVDNFKVFKFYSTILLIFL